MIDWKPIGQLPDDRKDGRPVLLWADGEPWVAVWDNTPYGLTSETAPYGWADARENGARITDPEWWSDISVPEQG